MPKYKCNRCLHTSDSKRNMERHIAKKNPCKGTNEPTIIVEDEEIICEYCKNNFFNQASLIRHQDNACKSKVLILKNKLFEAQEKIKVLEDEKKKLVSGSATDGNVVVNINTINNTNNFITVQLRPYNDPKLPDDMDDIYEDAWSKKKSIATFIERIHFNPDLPENHNICITNLRNNLARVFTEQGWITRDQDNLLDEIIATTTNLLDKWVNEKQSRKEYKDDYFEYFGQVGHRFINDDNKQLFSIIPPKLTNLNKIEITYCPLFSIIPLELTNLVNITIMNCPLFSIIPLELTKLVNIIIMDCPLFSIIPLELTNLVNITIIDCPLFSNIPPELTKLVNISIIDCPLFSIIPPELTKLVNIKIINCSLTSIQGNFSKLVELECSNCSSLTSIQGNFPKLVLLTCSNCPLLNSIPEPNQLVKIKTIVCEGSDIRITKSSYPSLQKCDCCSTGKNTTFIECTGEINDRCAICLKNFKNDIEKNKCFIPALVDGEHQCKFHKKCLLNSLQRNNNICPLCRAIIETNNNPPENIDEPDSDAEFGKRRSIRKRRSRKRRSRKRRSRKRRSRKRRSRKRSKKT